MQKKIRIIGGGLAGSEAALQFAKRGWQVDLYEMRPKRMTPAHSTDKLGELVCSNSLKSSLLTTASGLLKAELRLLGSELLKIADEVRVPAGNALAVDRDLFSEKVTERILQESMIKVHNEEVKELGDEPTILATGPLTSDAMSSVLNNLVGQDDLHFYDAIAPIISAESINREIVYRKSRYDKGTADYLNCPFTKEEYLRFVDALLEGEIYMGKSFEGELLQKNIQFYENCTPVEELAKRGKDTLRFGVMRPVGLELPDTGRRPYAVIQLRSENNDETAFNLVGCQTMMTQDSQRKVFRMIPGLESAEFYRYGSIHRNSYINAPLLLNRDLSLKTKKNVYIAGQLSGVEGYVESIASGLLVSLIITERLDYLPNTTIIGQLWERLTNTDGKEFTPQNANYGLLPPLEVKVSSKAERKETFAKRAIQSLEEALER
ncbi:MAG: methylenetetrahydrofolate--tRNA-(uracil(54)-C(5))-methyltransferase (FADH(2)-oxidizing) TrmFO [Candidatus Cloacimonas sp.]|nr:methylenetetrahydrofolate--tRNA-(uracil(54)-C(5))-methyltransferase (FADH(2)-oxidizing) TrmFO [Candidatus Cloacimonadota bacterium]